MKKTLLSNPLSKHYIIVPINPAKTLNSGKMVAMLEKSKIDNLVEFINSQIQEKMGNKLTAVYLVGSYPMGVISETRPDVNWLLIWNADISGEDRWELGKILSKAINEFEKEFTVRPEFRPFKFSYPFTKTKYDVFVNISNAYMSSSIDTFRERNKKIPDYMFAGFKNTRKLVSGEDVLARIEFEVSIVDIIETVRNQIEEHKVQLDKIPLTYHLKHESDLIYNESLVHGKALIYLGVEMLMTDEELRSNLFLNFFNDDIKTLNFFYDRFADATPMVATITEYKKMYPQWKYEKTKAKDIYLAAYDLCLILGQYFDSRYTNL